MTGRVVMQGNVRALLFGLVVALSILGAADTVFGHLHAARVSEQVRSPDLYAQGIVPDARYGYRLRREMNLTTTKTVAGEHVYTVTYSTDERGRRTVPANRSAPEDDGLFAAFFGCSFAFGEGVENEETLPNQFAVLNPGVRVYNYGCPGHGPQQMLVGLELGDIQAGISGQEGLGIYVMMACHVNRAAGRMSVATQWGRDFPYYAQKNGNLVKIGRLDSARPALSAWYALLSKSGFIQYYHLDFPPLRRGHFRLTADIVASARDLFEAQYGPGTFKVVVYPELIDWGFTLDPVVVLLEERGVDVLDLRGMEINPGEHAVHPRHDLHPSARLHRLVAERLTSRLDPGLRARHASTGPSDDNE